MIVLVAVLVLSAILLVFTSNRISGAGAHIIPSQIFLFRIYMTFKFHVFEQ